ncbi:MAG TPA: secretin N-terminal domain-containing protein [Planctomycetota bacterium]|nr:secretin N-terminal domain-containing protein [Planctomycetota bacterium]
MNRIRGGAVLSGVAALLLAAPWNEARAQQQPPKPADDRKLGGVLQDVNLHDLTVAVQRITKKTIIWTEDLGLRNKRVHFISDKPIADDPEVLWKAYQSILQVSDLTLNSLGKEGEELYKLKPAPVAGKGNVPVQTGAVNIPEDRFVTRIFQLQFVSPRDVQASLINMASFPQNILSIESAGLLIATDFDFNIKRFEDIIKIIDVKKPDIELKMIPLKNAIATEIEQMMGGLVQTLIGRTAGPRVPGVPGVPQVGGSESVKVVADKRTNSVVLLAEPNRLPQLEEIVKRLDAETQFETSGIYISHLRHTNALDIVKTLNAMYRIGVSDQGVPSGGGQGAVRPGQAVGPTALPPPSMGGSQSSQLTGSEPTIVADVRSNSVIIVTDRNTYRTLEQIIRRLDQRRPQVLIKATVVEITANDTFDLGVELKHLEDPNGRLIGGGGTSFGLSQTTADPTTNSFSVLPNATPGLTLLALKDRIGNIPALLHALESKARVSILDQPEAATNDNGIAEISVKVQVPVTTNTITGTGISQTTFSRFEEASTTLTISPHISEGGYLRLETKVKIEKFTGTSADPNIPPPKTSREISTKEIMIPNGGTMVIGGIVTQDKSDSTSNVPLLGQIPLLGWLFRRDQNTDDKRTLYIFLTPYILYDYGFGDHRDLSRDRKAEIDRVRGTPLEGLNIESKPELEPRSNFRFLVPRAAGKEDRDR